MDFIVKLPKADEYDSILVVQDRRSKSAIFIPTIEAISSLETAQLVFDKVICKHGVPQSIVSDRGPQFKAHFWRHLLEILGSKALLSSAYHPETDGQSERMNQELETYLRCFTSYNQDNWPKLLPTAEFAHNNTYHTSIGMSPLQATTGQDASIEFLGSNTETPSSSTVPEASKMKERMDTIYKQVTWHLERALQRHKKNADEYRREEFSYNAGDEVMLSTKSIRTDRPTKKLDYKWIGPYLIKRKINNVAYEIELPHNVRIHNVFHISLLKPYIRPKDPTRQLPKPPPLRIKEDEGFIIENILDVRRRGKGWEYLIKWEGYGEEDNTWESRRTIDDEPMLEEWHKRHPKKSSPYKDLIIVDSIAGTGGNGR
ncbi:hypothetical protein SeLEV6574_g08402 [Synchytrium endobioticum]|uniref:Chromo domain-containing protein n=1 Tax=Synchytrium endobioticum TaxID=286115 RepID=A0A507C1B5_9FUNG|nr:hypothetical protein SeLEV6574_g08402 [Synchytrium endobioticum]